MESMATITTTTTTGRTTLTTSRKASYILRMDLVPMASGRPPVGVLGQVTSAAGDNGIF